MRRKLALAAIAWLVVVSAARAEEIKGIVRKVDAPNRQLTLVVGDNTKTVAVAKDASIVSQQPGDKKQAAGTRPIEAGLGGLKVGDEVTLKTEEQGGEPIATSIKRAQQLRTDSSQPDNKPAVAKKKAKKKPGNNAKANKNQASKKRQMAQNKGKTSPRRGKLSWPERNLNRSLKQIEQGLQRIQ